MDLGAFSLGLAVKKLGFAVFGGDPDQKWLILKSGTTVHR